MTDEISRIGRGAIVGSGVRIAEFVASTVIAFAGGIVLMRLLEVSMFGWFSISSLVFTLGVMFPDLIASGIVQSSEKPSQAQLKALFTIQFLIAAAIALVAGAAAPWIVARYKDLPPVCIPLMRVLALNFFFQSLRNIPWQILARELRFARLASIAVPGMLAYQAVAIIAAARGLGIWSFAAGACAKTIVELVLTFTYLRWKPGFNFRWRESASLLLFGSKMLAVRMCTFAKDYVSPILLGLLEGSFAVGIMDKAWYYGMIVVSVVSVTGAVIFPVTSRLAGHQRELKRFAEAAIHAIAVVGVPLAVGSALLAGPFVHFVWTEKWALMVPAIQFLFIHTLCNLFTTPLIAMLSGLGKMRQALRLAATWTALTWVSIAVFRLGFGYLGVAMGYSVAIVPVLGWLAWYAKRVLDVDLVRLVLRPLFASLVMACVLFWMDAGESVQGFVAAVLAGIAAYAVVEWTIDRKRLAAEYRTVIALLRPGDARTPGSSEAG